MIYIYIMNSCRQQLIINNSQNRFYFRLQRSKDIDWFPLRQDINPHKKLMSKNL